MLLRTGIFSILLVVIFAKYTSSDTKTEIIPLPQQSVSDKGDFVFNKTTLISVENEKQALIARELTNLFNQAAGFTPKIVIQDKQADIQFRTDSKLAKEHYKLNIAPSCILVEASGQKGFFYAMQTLRCLLPPAINSLTPIENIKWRVPGMTILDGPQCDNRSVVLYTPLHLIPDENLKELIDCMAMLKINRLHFMEGLYSAIPKPQPKAENMILYAQAKKVTISSGMMRPEGIASNLPFHVEQMIRESNIQHSKENKKQIFEHLVPIAEKSWSKTLPTGNR